MRKSTKLLKKFVALFLIVLMSIEGFAAIVSDNDGETFITKSEFDSLTWWLLSKGCKDRF